MIAEKVDKLPVTVDKDIYQFTWHSVNARNLIHQIRDLEHEIINGRGSTSAMVQMKMLTVQLLEMR